MHLNIIIKLALIIFTSTLLINCGFKPTYKISENEINQTLVLYSIENDATYETRQVVNNNLMNSNAGDAEFKVKLNVTEKEVAVNVKSDGSVSEYRIEALIVFNIMKVKDKELIYSAKTQGFANYDVSSSEYTNTQLRKNALESAVLEAIQLVRILVQSKINE